MARLGVDMGGTFTDVVMVDGPDLVRDKFLTDQADPAKGILAAVTGLLARTDRGLPEVEEIVHGTTLGSNVVLERNGRRTALITTTGFRDILVIQRQRRHDLYDFTAGKPRHLVDRRDVIEVAGRLDAEGGEVEPLSRADLERACEALAERGIVDVAVCLINSYGNPGHEQEVRDFLADRLPGVAVSLSSEISGRYREYERASTAVINAYVGGRLRDYLRGLESSLAREGFRGRLFLMQSNGGLATVESALRYPVRMIESGPAAGALMAGQIAMPGSPDALSFDMGGTTAKLTLCDAGLPAIAGEFEVDRVTLRPGSGLPIDVPSVDLIEIGSGGGSVAKVEDGIVRVGPESASSRPGPACYGFGGKRPTVTDANLVLGCLNPDFFLGGRMELDVEAARAAIERDVARPLGISVEEAAWAIHEIVTDDMAAAARMVSIERGKDPRRFALVASGGAGPAHAAEIAAKLGMGKVIIPAVAGVMSAVGLLSCDLRFEAVKTLIRPLEEELTAAEVERLYAELDARVAELLERAAAEEAAATLSHSVDARYKGQGHELEVELGGERPARTDLVAAARTFHDSYAALYGHFEPDGVVEGVNWRVSGSLRRPRVDLGAATAGGDGGTPTAHGTRPLYLERGGGYRECEVYRRDALFPGARLTGPAVVEDTLSAALLPIGSRAEVDAARNLVISFDREEEA